MKNLKKVLALVVALTMVFTTVAFASYPDVDTTADYAGAVELLSALEILEGDENGNFNPDNTITRAEFAAVVCRALGLEGSAASAKGATMFTDVAADHWASGYINLASQQGIVNGKGNGIFDPEGNVTYAEAVKMLVVAIGYEPMAATKGGWPTGYLSVANSTKLTAGVGGSADVAALRSTVAMLTANALEIPVMDQTAYGAETKYEPLDDYDNYTSLLTNMDVYKATGVITEVDLLEGEFSMKLSQESDDYEFGWANSYTLDLSKVPASFDLGTSNVASFVSQNVDVYVQKSGRTDYVALIAVPSGIGETLTIKASDLEPAAATISTSDEKTLEYYETVDADKASKVYVAANPTVIVNNVRIIDGSWDNADLYTELVTNITDARDAEIKFIEYTDDKYFDTIDITVYEHAIVDEVEVAKERINFLDSTRVSFDSDNEDQIVKIYNAEGAEITLEDIQAGDVLAMVVNELDGKLPKKAKSFKEEIIIHNLGANTVTGTLNQANEDDGYVYIDSVEYEYVSLFVSEKAYEDLFKNGEAKLGTEGTFYLGMTGKIIGFEGVEGSTGNYAFILQGADSDSTWDACYELKLLLADGSIVKLAVDDEVEIEGVGDVAYASQESYFKIPAFTNYVADPADVALDTDGDGWVETLEDDADVKEEGAVEVGQILNADAPNRVIDFKMNSKDVITYVDFVGTSDNDALNATKAFNVDTNKVGGATLASDVVIFKVDSDDADDATVVGLDSLVDEGTYQGYVAVKYNTEWDVMVMLEGDASFDPEAPLYVVDSVVKSTYGEDKEDSYAVTYYMDGTSDKATAIFTADAKNKGTYNYEELTKGSLFVANTAADGLVNEYVVFAKVVNDKYVVDSTAKVAAYGSEDAADVEIIYDQISTITNNKTIEFVNATAEDDYTILAAAAQYYYNTEGSKAKLESGDWNIGEVDEAIDSKANYAFVKVYDGTVTDIVTFSARETVE